EEALRLSTDSAPLQRARGLIAGGYLAYFLQDREAAHRECTQSIELFRGESDPWYLAVALDMWANIVLYEGDLDAAARLAEESLELARANGFHLAEAFAVFVLGFKSYLQRDLDAAA